MSYQKLWWSCILLQSRCRLKIQKRVHLWETNACLSLLSKLLTWVYFWKAYILLFLIHLANMWWLNWLCFSLSLSVSPFMSPCTRWNAAIVLVQSKDLPWIGKRQNCKTRWSPMDQEMCQVSVLFLKKGLPAILKLSMRNCPIWRYSDSRRNEKIAPFPHFQYAKDSSLVHEETSDWIIFSLRKKNRGHHIPCYFQSGVFIHNMEFLLYITNASLHFLILIQFCATM